MKLAGVDEVGRGPVAGPVVVSAVVFPEGADISEFHDSKTLTEKKRETLTEQILELASAWTIIALGPQTIDQINILRATEEAMQLALVEVGADKALVDGNMKLATKVPYEPIIKGDLLHPEIGAASILAKVWRDRLMVSYEKLFSGYGLDGHKGYPTKKHREALFTLGPSPIHRYSFRTVQEATKETGVSPTQMQLSETGDCLIVTNSYERYHQLPTPSQIRPAP